MIAILADLSTSELINPWRFQPHPEVWLLVAFVFGAYIYAARVIGPVVVKAGPVITTKQRNAFIAAILMLWLASDWPVHDIAEEYLYSVHMFQHMVLSYFMPPLVLLAIPKWLFESVFGHGRARRVISFLAKPVIAGVAFNLIVMITHIPDVVNRSVSNAPMHYGLHVALVLTALLVWMPICGPDRQLHLQSGGKMIYLFLMSVVPTVPAGWLTFAEGVVYKHYDIAIRVWGVSVTTDQQVAGAMMKIGGSFFIWAIIVFIFFKRFTPAFSGDRSYLSTKDVEKDSTLTFEEVQDAFGRVPPAPDPNVKS
ncbi:MAG: cytochrome c oxidase assembly protein [Actinobacteria bacterium]|nr:cytochrome c oxidase assembly protein [Actinomycetota bacterium]